MAKASVFQVGRQACGGVARSGVLFGTDGLFAKSYSLESRVAQNDRPLSSKVGHSELKVAHNYGQLAFQVFCTSHYGCRYRAGFGKPHVSLLDPEMT